MKEVHTVQRKNCLPCGEKTRYRAAVKSAYRAQGKPVSTTRYMLKKAEKRLRQMMEE